jgi:hypothetical protein
MSVQVDEHPARPAAPAPADGPTERSAPAGGERVARLARLRHRAERVLAPVVVIVVAVWTVGPNLANGPAKAELGTLWRPAVVLGFDQDWRVFSPNPVSQSLEVLALVDLDDGTQVEWHAPERNLLFGAYTEYRWQKWQERVRLDMRSDLWAPAATWIADQVRSDGRNPVRVRLVRRWREHLPLTSQGINDGDWQSYVFFELAPGKR